MYCSSVYTYIHVHNCCICTCTCTYMYSNTTSLQGFWLLQYVREQDCCIQVFSSQFAIVYLLMKCVYMYVYICYVSSLLFICVLFFVWLPDCLFKIVPMHRYSAQEQFRKATTTTRSMPDVVILQKLQVFVHVYIFTRTYIQYRSDARYV